MQELNNGAWRDWNVARRYDEDLAGHITVTNRRGICLCGAAIEDVFPEVPRKDFLASIIGDVLSSEFGLNSELEYPVYVVLNACRTYAFLVTGEILSKREGGIWALKILPRRFHATIMNSLDAYGNDKDDSRLSKEAVAELSAYMRNELERLLQCGG